MADISFLERLTQITDDIDLGMECTVFLGHEEAYDLDGNDIGRFYTQIHCWRLDVITGEMGWGKSGKAYHEPEQSDGQITQAIFGLYQGYWIHEARENFKWRGRRIYGPHGDVEALWEAAGHVDIPSARHEGER